MIYPLEDLKYRRSRVVPSKEGLTVLDSVLLCLYRIKSFVSSIIFILFLPVLQRLVHVTPDDCTGLLLSMKHISMTDKLLLLEVYKKLMKFHPQYVLPSLKRFLNSQTSDSSASYFYYCERGRI